MIKLVCGDCQQENEPERIYCRNCGTRLDRSALSQKKIAEEDSAAAHKRVKSMFDPNRDRLRLMFFMISKLILAACFAAALIQIARPPDVPPRTKTVMLGSQITLDLENAVLYRRQPQLRFSEEQVNAFLIYALKTKQKDLDKPILTFERVIAQFSEDVCRITAQRSIYGDSRFSIYTTASYAVAIQDAKLVAKSKGGNLGRLPIHPALMEYADVIFNDVWKALDRERKNVSKLSAIDFEDKAVTLTTGAATGTAAQAVPAPSTPIPPPAAPAEASPFAAPAASPAGTP